MGMSDVSLRWKPIVDRVKARLASKNGSMPRKLDAALDEAVATFDSLLQDIAGLELENRTQRSRIRAVEGDWDYLFRTVPIACVMTDTSGTILRGNDRAAVLLNTSARHLEKETTPLTYFAQDREAFFTILKTMATSRESVQGTLPLRPRERAPLPVDVSVVPRSADDDTFWLWFLVPCARVQPSDTSKGRSTPVDIPSS